MQNESDTKVKEITTEELERIFDEGKEDVLQYFDLSKARILKPDPQRVNVDFPGWMVSALDKEASRIGVTRQSLIKMWLADRLKQK